MSPFSSDTLPVRKTSAHWIHAILKKENFPKKNCELAVALRNVLLEIEDKEPGYRDLLSKRGCEWFEQDREAMNNISECATSKTDPDKPRYPPQAVKGWRDKFWSLYWGVLGLVEGKEVLDRMVDFGRVLREWELTGKKATPELLMRLQLARCRLFSALDAELKVPIDKLWEGGITQ